MQDFQKLQVWQRPHQLVLDVYQATASFPVGEVYGLTAQLRRSAASIPANIAEGCGRGSNRDLIRFLHIATGSLSETQYHLILARDLGYLAPSVHATLDREIVEIRRMLASLIGRISGS